MLKIAIISINLLVGFPLMNSLRAGSPILLDTPLVQEPDGVVFDIDLSKGSVGHGASVQGGKWENGWRVVTDDDRIVWDTGYPIKNGAFEVWVTMKGKITDAVVKGGVEKFHWAGLHQQPTLGAGRDYWQARTGGPHYKFSKMRLKGYGQPDSYRCELSVGDFTDWPSDDQKVIKVKFEWKDGVNIFHDPKGTTHSCTQAHLDKSKPLVISSFRYAFIGNDNYKSTSGQRTGSVKGMRYVRVRLVDYNAKKR
jgi:hypothetical protein